jgi:hypothetical protein
MVEQVSAVLVMIGLLACIFITGRRWSNPLLRLLPFVYATVIAVVGSWYVGKTGVQMLSIVVVANFVAAGMLLAMWIDSPRKRKP